MRRHPHTCSRRSVRMALAAALAFSTDAGAQVRAPSPSSVPIGTVMAFAGKAIPVGWLLCDGQPLRKADYPELFAAVDTSYGSGLQPDGSKVPGTDFNLPDYRGVFLRGVDADRNGVAADRDSDRDGRRPARGTGGNRGNAVGSYQEYATALPTNPFSAAEAGGHRHHLDVETTASRAARGRDEISNTLAYPFVGPRNVQSAVDGQHGHVVSIGGDRETRPRNVSVYWIIKAR